MYLAGREKNMARNLENCMHVTDAAVASYISRYITFFMSFIDPSMACWNVDNKRWEPKSGLIYNAMKEEAREEYHNMVVDWLSEHENGGIPTIEETVEDVTENPIKTIFGDTFNFLYNEIFGFPIWQVLLIGGGVAVVGVGLMYAKAMMRV
jgi:hypothetical protein